MARYFGWHLGLIAAGVVLTPGASAQTFRATPKEIVERLNALTGGVLTKPEVREFHATENVDALSMPPAVFATKVRIEHEKWGKLIREKGLKTSG